MLKSLIPLAQLRGFFVNVEQSMDQKEFVSTISGIIQKNYPTDRKRGLKASEVGVLIRVTLPDIKWEDLGFQKLKDILAELESQKLIETGYDDNHAFTVWLPGSSGDYGRKNRETISVIQGTSGSFRPLRKPVWTAFVSVFPVGRRFIRKTDGFVSMGMDDHPLPNTDWIEIDPISQETQKSWAKEFLSKFNIEETNELTVSLNEHTWYRTFVEQLRKQNPDDAYGWQRLRSSRVVEFVRKWVQQKGVSDELVFEPRIDYTSLSKQTQHAKVKNLRDGLLAAIAAMNTNELLELRIPAKCLLGVFCPELMSPGRSHLRVHE